MRGDARMTMEFNTTKDTIGCKAVASMSSWVIGGCCGEASFWIASVEVYTAPTPICRYN